MKFFFLILVFCLSSFSLFAQEKTLKDIAATQNLSVEVVALFADNKITKAVNLLVPYWPISDGEVEDFTTKTIKYFNIFDQNYGKPIGTVKIKNEKIGEIALRETYFIQFEYTAVRLIFTYYKGKEGWILNSFKWDDSFTEEF